LPKWALNQCELKTITLTRLREENIMRQRATVFAFFLSMAIAAASQYTQAANLSV